MDVGGGGGRGGLLSSRGAVPGVGHPPPLLYPPPPPPRRRCEGAARPEYQTALCWPSGHLVRGGGGGCTQIGAGVLGLPNVQV